MPFARYFCIFINVGLGEAAKMPAATALASSAGNITIPVLIGGVQRTALLQWKMVSVPQSTDGNMVVVDDSWPVAFPNACLSINPSLVNSVIYATNGAPFVSAAIVDRVKFKAACAYTKSNSTVAVLPLRREHQVACRCSLSIWQGTNQQAQRQERRQ